MKRFMRMVGMMIAETMLFVVALYGMLAITGFMYYEDIIRYAETYDTVTNVFGVGIVLTYLAFELITIYETIKRSVYEIGMKEI